MAMPSPQEEAASPAPITTGSEASPVAASPVAVSPGALPTSDQLAALLGPDDFTAAGVPGAAAPSVNPGDPGSAYIVYAGPSSAGGGIELDVFVYETLEDAASLVFDPGIFALDEASKQTLGAERATFMAEQATNDGTGTFDTLWAQKGRLAFALGIPTTDTSRDQLLALGRLVLERSAAYQ
jgi:hypothetical protein